MFSIQSFSMSLDSFSVNSSVIRRAGKRRGVPLTVMVCGRVGSGKSTFVNTLCDGEVFPPQDPTQLDESPTLEITSKTVPLVEPDGTGIMLTVVDTPGFGNDIDNFDGISHVRRYIEGTLKEYLTEESRIERSKRRKDNRVHCCLYFISCTGRGLSELDIRTMSELSTLVNVIPVLARCDSLTDEELRENKHIIREELKTLSIPIYSFGHDIEEDDPEIIEECEALRDMVPFAVCGSNEVYTVDGQYVRGRSYPWGFSRPDDPEYSDLLALRAVLFGTHFHDLKESTQSLYEVYRTKELSQKARPRQEVLKEFEDFERVSKATMQASLSHLEELPAKVVI